MAHRLLIGLGAAALLTAGTGALAPAAFAQDLPAGVSCSGSSCRNDNDDAYRVRIRVSCQRLIDGYDSSVWVAAHSTKQVPANCPGHWEQGPMQVDPPKMEPDGTWSAPSVKNGPDEFKPGFVTGIEYLSAAVDNNPPAPTPSGSGS
ncbi:hypothetical protein D7D52_25800 [Nocardia yunnanensis]|uniref:Secreted protein n=1 Tax=Nocardia yunnanensis TaxID=2382165 RepID=A0A386ZHJ0_9NOCA|nr:hypothetical protein [Nocardia yunnanensis]AYF76663.1 hypothetical protein D7D52_25800 [Nocardia yunnanensis]